MRILCIVIFATSLLGADLQPGQKVILSSPPGYRKWILSDSCTIASLLVRNAAYRSTISDRINAGAENLALYDLNTTAVILEVEDDCAYVQTLLPKGKGWVYEGLISLTAAEQKRIASEREVAAKKKKAQQDYLASLPQLTNGSGTVLIATDDGCYKDLVKTQALSGLELRKKLVELVEFGCLFAVPSGTHAETSQRKDGSYSVTIRDGPGEGKSGIATAGSVRK